MIKNWSLFIKSGTYFDHKVVTVLIKNDTNIAKEGCAKILYK